jgi:exosortase/archaeosortase family protein
MIETLPTPAPRRRYPDLWTGLVLFALTAAVFLPVFHWLAEQTITRDQIQYSIIILAAALAVTLWRERRSIVLRLKLSRVSLGWVAAAYLMGALAILLRNPAPLLVGFLFAFIGGSVFLIGDEHIRLCLILTAGFAAFLIIVVLFPLLDLPLRKVAGLGAADILQSLGFDTTLGMVGGGAYPKLILLVDGTPFHVATECNGFGLITSCALLAFLVTLTGQETWLWRIILIFSGILIGFLLNTARIVIICLVAPRFPDHYTLVHEGIGTAALWLGVGLTWWIVSPSGPAFLRRSKDTGTAA